MATAAIVAIEKCMVMMKSVVAELWESVMTELY
jgi:hypothetical protein